MKIKLNPNPSPTPQGAPKPGPLPELPRTPDLGLVNLRRVPMTVLTPAAYNPRTMTEKARRGLSNSIASFGLVQPIIWNERSGNIVGGHQRYAELKEQGVAETDVIVVSLDESHEKALNITLNNEKIAGDFSESILEVLAEVESEIGLEGFVKLQLDSLELDLKKQFLGDEPEALPDAKKPAKDLSNNIQDKYEVIVECQDCFGQQAVYDQLNSMGLKCRLLTL